MRELYWGLSGDDVSALQTNLQTLGYYTDTVDGYYGDSTFYAVQRFQTDNGLYADGGAHIDSLNLITTKATETASDVLSGQFNPINSNGGSKEMGRWGDYKFQVTPELIKSFTDLKIHGSAALNTADETNQGYASFKGSNPTEITFTLPFNAEAGVDVRTECMSWVTASESAWKNYLYVGKSKLIESLTMVTDATVSKVVISPTGIWISAEVTITLQKCDTVDNAGSGASGGGGDAGGGGSYGGYTTGNANTGSSHVGSAKLNTGVVKIGALGSQQTNRQESQQYAQQQAARVNAQTDNRNASQNKTTTVRRMPGTAVTSGTNAGGVPIG